jgi:hypothetical protein
MHMRPQLCSSHIRISYSKQVGITNDTKLQAPKVKYRPWNQADGKFRENLSVGPGVTREEEINRHDDSVFVK